MSKLPDGQTIYVVLAKSSVSDDGGFFEFVAGAFVIRARAEAFIQSVSRDSYYDYEINETTLDIS